MLSKQRGRGSRPYVILNSAMSLDGKIATFTGDSRLSSPEDLRRVHRLRASVDGIMIGVGTLLADDPNLTVKHAKGPNPTRIIVDSNARTPLNANVVRTARQTPTVVAVTSRAQLLRVRGLRRAGVRVLSCGNRSKVSLPILMKNLRAMRINRILLEGGGTMNWSMLNQRLVDEVSVAISPRILGGADATTLVDGEGVSRVREGVELRLLSRKKYGKDLVLRYEVT